LVRASYSGGEGKIDSKKEGAVFSTREVKKVGAFERAKGKLLGRTHLLFSHEIELLL